MKMLVGLKKTLASFSVRASSLEIPGLNISTTQSLWLGATEQQQNDWTWTDHSPWDYNNCQQGHCQSLQAITGSNNQQHCLAMYTRARYNSFTC